MISSGKLGKAPVGTQRYWESTGQTWIKTHDNTIFDNNISPWIPMPSIPSRFKDLFYSLDQKGRKIVDYKDPVDGDLWLTKEFEEFVTESGKVFRAADFKQYSAFDSRAAKYSFTSELTKRLEQDKIDLNAKIADNLIEVNQNTKTEKLREGENVGEKSIVLTPDQIKEVKEYVRNNFKGGDDKLTLEDVYEIDKILTKVLTYLEKGEDFEGDQATVYQTCKDILEQLKTGPYVSINITRDSVEKAYKLMALHFSDNWGIRESFRKKMENAFSDFVQKYKTQIEEEELESFKQKLGVSLYSPTDEFYTALKASEFFKPVDIDSYIGQLIPDPDDKYGSVTLLKIDLENGSIRIKKLSGEERTEYVSTNRLINSIRQREFNLPDIDIPLKLRLVEKFKKDLKGTFDINDLTLLETFERINDFLPEGHSINNNVLRTIRKQDSFTSDNSYAHYNGGKSEIFLSSKCVSHADIGIVDIHSGQEIASTLIHEIGHAVSNKLGRRDSREYRRFAVECGWSWEQFQIGDRDQNYIATGDDPDIKRFGSKSDRKLITEYAGKSPEEAFAEYYSVYSQYKNRIDKYLEDGKISHLEKDKTMKVDLSKKYLHEFFNDNEEGSQTIQSIYAVLQEAKRNLDDHIRVDVIDPYNYKLDTLTEKDVLPGHIAFNKRSTVPNKKEPQPVFSVFDYHTGKYDFIKDQHDVAIHYSNKYLRRNTPTFSISKECYNLLTEKGFSYHQIRDFTLAEKKNSRIPDVLGEHKKENIITGLNYRGRVIPNETLHNGREIFVQMKKIWESEELKKALQDLNIFENNDIMEKAEEFNELKFKDAMSEAFKPFIDTIRNVLQSPSKNGKKHYSDIVLRNTKGEILLLRRSDQDDFMPGKWWLPGGKIDPGEDPIVAAERELFEESGIDMKGKLSFIIKREKPDCSIHYFEAFIDKPIISILDNEEHFGLEWVSLNNLENYDLLGTKEELLSLPTSLLSEVEETVISMDSSYDLLFRKQNAIACLFNIGQISDEKYFELRKALKTDTFTLIQASFNKGEVTEEQYLSARKLVR